MNQRLAQLENLLSRVQERAQEPRVRAVASVQAQNQSEVEAELEAVVKVSEPPLAFEAAADSQLGAELLQEAPISHSGRRADALLNAEESAPEVIVAEEEPLDTASVEVPAHDHAEQPEHVAPTMEQLGETVLLEEGPAAEFELDAPDLSSESSDLVQSSEDQELQPLDMRGQVSAELSQEELTSDPRVSLNAAGGGNFDASLSAPLGAKEDLDRVILGEVSDIPASISERPVLSTNVVEFISAASDFKPESFAQLLDSSLKL